MSETPRPYDHWLDQPDEPNEEEDEYEQAIGNCHSFLDGGVYVCMSVGSEDCDECPFHGDLGKTPKQVEEDGIP
jgi:hypothetical protein